MNANLKDIHLLAQQFPDTINLPDQQKVNGLGPDCFVQLLSERNEGFWVKIVDNDDEGFTGTIEVIPSDKEIAGFPVGNTVRFKKCHIADLGCDRYCWC